MFILRLVLLGMDQEPLDNSGLKWIIVVSNQVIVVYNQLVGVNHKLSGSIIN